MKRELKCRKVKQAAEHRKISQLKKESKYTWLATAIPIENGMMILMNGASFQMGGSWDKVIQKVTVFLTVTLF